MVDTKLLIGYTTAEYGRRADFYDYLFLSDRPEGSLVLPAHGPSPAKNRNILAEASLAMNRTHLLLVDDDNPFPKDAVMNIMKNADKDIVTGVYLTRAYPHQPLVFDEVDADGKAAWSYLDEQSVGVKEKENCGLGFVLIKTDVFRKMEKPWFRLGEIDPEQWSDDVGFFNRARAAGFKIFVDYNVKIGHFGTMIIWPEYDEKEKKWYAVYDTNGLNKLRFPLQIPVKYEFTGKS